MEGECFVCVSSASEKCTLVLPEGKQLENKVLCSECLSDLRALDFITVKGPTTRQTGDTEVNPAKE